MIVVDTSVLLAIFLNEPERECFTEAMFDAGSALISAPTAFEFLMVAAGRRRGVAELEPRVILSRTGVRIEPWTARHVEIAHAAFARYGKGQGHPAQLNFGDCMSYALAKSLGVPLLYKGNDFAQTDIISAI